MSGGKDFCVKCRTATHNNNSTFCKAANGAAVRKSACATCKSPKSAFVKQSIVPNFASIPSCAPKNTKRGRSPSPARRGPRRHRRTDSESSSNSSTSTNDRWHRFIRPASIESSRKQHRSRSASPVQQMHSPLPPHSPSNHGPMMIYRKGSKDAGGTYYYVVRRPKQ